MKQVKNHRQIQTGENPPKITNEGNHRKFLIRKKPLANSKEALSLEL